MANLFSKVLQVLPIDRVFRGLIGCDVIMTSAYIVSLQLVYLWLERSFPNIEEQIKFNYIFEALNLYYNTYGAT